MTNTPSASFRPIKYSLYLNFDSVSRGFKGALTIEGQKLPPPSKRITLHQQKLKILTAEIIRKDKKGEKNIFVKRINHLSSFEEVRLHTEELLYPGHYFINIEYSGTGDAATIKKMLSDQALWKKLSWRGILPSIDEENERASSDFSATYISH